MQRQSPRCARPWTDPSSIAVAEYLDEWLQDRAVDLKEATVHGYKSSVKRIVPHIGRVNLQDLSPTHVRRLMTALHNEGRAPKTIENTHSVLRAALGRALNHGLIPRNPIAGIKAPPVPRRPHTVWTPDEIRAFLDLLGDS